MNKSIFLALVLSLIAQYGWTQNENSNKEESAVEFYVGFIFAPYAATTFDADEIFIAGTNLFFTPVIAKGDWSFAPFYNLSSNNAGVFVTYSISDQLGAYVVADKALKGNTGNYVLGFTTPVASDDMQLFVEGGSNYGDDPTPFLGLGIYFNIFKRINFR